MSHVGPAINEGRFHTAGSGAERFENVAMSGESQTRVTAIIMVQATLNQPDISARSRHRDIALDPRLNRDCHDLGTLERARLLLHRQAGAGWLILVPDTPAVDWHELDDAEFELINHQIRQLCRWASEWFGADKMNVATIGNHVSQMHIHIVARHRHDPWWPEPVWGHAPSETHEYDMVSIQAMRDALGRRLNLMPAED